MPSLYLGVRLPEKRFHRFKLDDINLTTKNILDLKMDAERILNYSYSNLELFYCGNVLKEDHQSLEQQGVKAGSTILVFHKQMKIENVAEPVTDEQIQRAVLSYRLIVDIAGTSLAKALRPEVLKKVLDAYPEFYTNLGAYAILKDSILISQMSSIETAINIAEEYPILIRSAEFVTKVMKEYLSLNKPDLSTSVLPSEDSLSDSSSSENDSPASNNQARTSNNIRQVSRDQLSAALLLAGSSSLNSLSNIAQRNTNSSAGGNMITPSTSSSNIATSVPSTSSGGISNSLFSNALSNALLFSQQPSTQSSSQQPQAEQSQRQSQLGATGEDNLAERYANELRTMREMGLSEEMVNIQALVVSNGDVESAINLVLSGLGNFN